MKYESAKTEKGNVGVSYESQEAADMQAKQMDENGNTNCSNCSRCTGCSDCSDCSDCSRCSGCSGCSGCSDCSRCSGCYNCSGCSGCSGCSRCSGCYNCSETHGALCWNGNEAKNLTSVNGLRWTVSTDGKSIQIGCQHHSVDEWRAFDDRVIARMGSDALAFWTQHKNMILGMAEVRRLMEETE